MPLNANLFVYGSLMSTAGHPMGARLWCEARCLGPATIQGRLYAISWYPGLADAASGSERVHGEVYELADAAASLAWLDEYEGLVPGALHHGEYERVERPVRLADGRDLVAWVYVYRQDVSSLTPVAGGRWQPQRG